MSDQPTVSAANATPISPTVVHPTFPLPRSWKVAIGVASVMVALALLGVGLTTTQREIAPKYWIALVPVYGLLCVWTAWNRTRHGEGGRVLIIRQIIHWLVIAAALALDFLIRGTGEETGAAAGYNALLLLAIGCLLAGVHLEWLFTLVGLLLVLTLVMVVKADQYLWLVVIGGAMVLAAMLGGKRLWAKFGPKPRT